MGEVARIATHGDEFVAATSTASDDSILTSRRIVSVSRDRQLSMALSEPLRQAPVVNVFVARESLFVGFNIGEWGGGLRRIDRKSGELSSSSEAVAR